MTRPTEAELAALEALHCHYLPLGRCRDCTEIWPCTVTRLITGYRELVAAGDDVWHEVADCTCHEDYKRRNQDDPQCIYHRVGAEEVDRLRAALGKDD